MSGAEAAPAAAPAPEGPPAERQLRALVVEDDAGTADFLSLGLRYERFEVQVCADGLDAVRLAARLTPREFALLHALLDQPRRVFAKQDLLERVWGYDYSGDDNIVELYVGYLRHKLDDRSPPRLIRTVRGVGYTLHDD